MREILQRCNWRNPLVIVGIVVVRGHKDLHAGSLGRVQQEFDILHGVVSRQARGDLMSSAGCVAASKRRGRRCPETPWLRPLERSSRYGSELIALSVT